MKMQQCANGHFYDASKSAECPYCSPASQSMSRTIPSAGTEELGGSDAIGKTSPIGGGSLFDSPPPSPLRHACNTDGGSEIGRTVPVNEQVVGYGRTQAVIHKRIGLDPVVGWVVCAEGKERGRDYRIHSGNNEIGRDGSVDIQIVGDDSISKKDMATITYDDETRAFFLVAGRGRNVVRVNGELLPTGQARALRSFDRIKLGESTLLFLPLCGEAFNWI